MIELDCKLTPAPEMVVLRELQASNASSGGFILSDDSLENSRTGFFIVEAVGSVAKRETNLIPGDYVYADRLASHYHTSPVCVMKWDNVLLITDENKKSLKSLPGWALITEATNEGSGFIVSDNLRIRHGVIKSINPPSKETVYPFRVGDDVMITKNCDVFDGFGEDRLIAMKLENIIARFDADGDN